VGFLFTSDIAKIFGRYGPEYTRTFGVCLIPLLVVVVVLFRARPTISCTSKANQLRRTLIGVTL
jgi:hypothetical protein